MFKGERSAICRDRADIDINEGEKVIVEAERGIDLGTAALVGSLVRLKRGKGETRGIIRRATQADLDIAAKNAAKEKEAFKVAREKIAHYRLDMKLVDIEMQFDSSKITFYFTAAQRVDFRELVKDLASVYRVRIELRQIGVRDEAKRIGGLGICGRKQCCSAFLTEFEQITTQMAKNQELALNPTKISGNCGRLLCCLRYEDDLYLELFKAYPAIGSKLVIDKKNCRLDFINIFTEKALLRFEDGTQAWLSAEEIARGASAPKGALAHGN
ncbi:MAG: signal peptidase II [Chitinispirillaceae bacterium]|nr:signal peptidase II [Chitinispirillaceae bacterium]